MFVALFAITACRPSFKLPAKSSAEYNELVRTFYIGLAALQVGHDVQADSKLAQFTQLAPIEPAGWANWGLLALRQRNFDMAAERLHRARDLAPENDGIYYLMGLLESSRGRSTEAINALRKAVELNPGNLISIYKLAEEVERQGDENSAAEFQRLMQQILAAQPDNIAALVELSRVAAKRADADTLRSAVAKIRQAIDDNGQDVTDIIRTLDGKALDTFGRGQYQGATRDHYVEVELGDGAPTSGPLYLVAHSSIHDTESSINVAITQGNRWRAQAMSLEVPDGHGGWTIAQSNLGFPAGRKKTVLFNLTNVFRPGTPRRVRVRTNLEIYWDQIEWAQGLPGTPLKMVPLAPSVADLHYRGYSVINRPDAGAPEVPNYNTLLATKQSWRDLIGYYTRYGEVGELLKVIDDRYVIVSSGDEMSLRFPEQPPPPAGWVRDYVIMGDGWIKDGDYNSTFSRTVLPLPYHGKREYVTKPGKLEDEWAYRKFPDDWQKYHTRYVTPDVFRNVLRSHAANDPR